MPGRPRSGTPRPKSVTRRSQRERKDSIEDSATDLVNNTDVSGAAEENQQRRRTASPTAGKSVVSMNGTRNRSWKEDWLAKLRYVLLRKRLLAALCVILIAINMNEDNLPKTSETMPLGMVVEDPNRPGKRFNMSNIKVRKPVVLIPGFVSTALEVWEGHPCIKSNITSSFRQRIFSAQLLLELVSNPECYMRHVSLRRESAGDPEGIKLRPDEGLDAADYLVPGFWVWGKVIINLADIGYEPRELQLAAYDWRLSPDLMEKRDGYFSSLKSKVELLVKQSSGLRAVAISHSYGSNVFAEFTTWADAQQPGWTDHHIDSFVNVGGPLMGIPKAFAAMASGEFKDTALLPSVAKMAFDAQMSHRMRYDAFRTWPCLWSMLPRGPDAAWPKLLTNSSTGEVLSATSARAWLRQRALDTNHTFLASRLDETVFKGQELIPFPTAKKTTVYCFYGAGDDTEHGYSYHSRRLGLFGGRGEDEVIDQDAPNKGVHFGPGDATVPLVSLGYTCRSRKRGWAAKTNVVTREFNDEKVSLIFDPRGGVRTGDHVDIMGNYEMIEQLLLIATGNGDRVEERIVSNIDELTTELDRESKG